MDWTRGWALTGLSGKPRADTTSTPHHCRRTTGSGG
jgi:hypothetical protein